MNEPTPDKPDTGRAFDLGEALKRIQKPGFLDEALADDTAAMQQPGAAEKLAAVGTAKADTFNTLKLRGGLLMLEYANRSTRETVRIFVRDAGTVARWLPGEGPTKFRLVEVQPASPGFLEYYAAGRRWPGVLREWYRPEPWEPLAWDWPAMAIETIRAGGLVLRAIGTKTCTACGKPAEWDSMDEQGRCEWCHKTDEPLHETAERVRKGTTVVNAGRMPERNAPCPCGSGRKFKRCCGK